MDCFTRKWTSFYRKQDCSKGDDKEAYVNCNKGREKGNEALTYIDTMGNLESIRERFEEVENEQKRVT